MAVVPTAIFQAESKIAFQEKDTDDAGGAEDWDSPVDSAS